MTQIRRILDRVSCSLRTFHEDQEGLNTIELVLIICCAATLLAVAYKYLWGTGSTGIIAVAVKNTINNFTQMFTPPTS